MIIDFLMSIDRDKLTEVPTEKVRAKRLSEIAGEDVFVTLSALPGDRYAEIAGGNVRKGEFDYTRTYDMQSLMVTEAVKDPDLKNAELQKHFGAATPRDLARILFPGGEIAKLFEVVARLSGYGEDEGLVEQVKKLVKTDADAQAMFYLFVNHHLPPSVYYDAHESDKRVMRAFIALEVDEERQRAERESK